MAPVWACGFWAGEKKSGCKCFDFRISLHNNNAVVVKSKLIYKLVQIISCIKDCTKY